MNRGEQVMATDQYLLDSPPMDASAGDADVALLQRGLIDEGDFEVIYRRYKPRLTRYADLRGARDPEGAADLALLDGHQAISRMENRSLPAFRSYLYQAVRSHIVAESRRREPVSSDLDEIHPVVNDPTEALLDSLSLHEFIADLPQAQRAVIEGRFLLDQTATEVGHQLDKDPNAVYQLQHRALATLRRKIERSGLDLAAFRAIALAILVTVGGFLALWFAQHRSTSTQPVSSTEEDPNVDRSESQERPNSLDNPQRSRSATGGFVESIEPADDESSVTETGLDVGSDAESSGPGQSSTTDQTRTAVAPNAISVTTMGLGVQLSVPATTVPAPATTTNVTVVSPSVTTTTVPATTVPSAPEQGELVSLSGTIAIRSALTGDYLWVRSSDITLRSDESSFTFAGNFTIVPIQGSVIALQSSVGDRGRQIAVRQDAESALTAGGTSGDRRELLVYRMTDGTYRFESVRHPGRYLRVDGNTIDSLGTIASGAETRFEIVTL